MSGRQIEVGGDFDLTGLTLATASTDQVDRWREGQWPGVDDKPLGSLDLRLAVIKGRLRLTRRLAGDPRARTWAVVPGVADLTGASAEELEISSHSFADVKAFKQARTAGWDAADRTELRLRRGNFRRLVVGAGSESGPVARAGSKRARFPVPIDLLDTRIGSWSIGGEHEPAADEYLDVLDNDPVFRRATYRAVESYLRDRGDEDAADRVHVMAMRQAGREARRNLHRSNRRGRHPRAALSWCWNQLQRGVFGYGTSWFRPLVLIAALYVPSVAIFRDCRNVEPSIQARGASDDEFKPVVGEVNACKPEYGWGTRTGALLALRYHLPVIGFEAPSKWQASDQMRPEFRGWRFPLTAAGWATMMTIANWILWPVALAGLFGIVRRRS